jgi:prepilin-type N-terminal cleavage/methylation domain-containing protein
MNIKKMNEKGFSLIEVIVTLVLAGITAVLAGLWISSVAKGYLFTQANMDNQQKAQLAMTRLNKEFLAIIAVDEANTSAGKITYTRSAWGAGLIAGQIVESKGNLIQINGHTLTDNVNAFSLAYCDDVTSSSCPHTWSSTKHIIEITMTLSGADGIQSTFTQRVAPRNL